MPKFIEIEEIFCGRTDVRTDGRMYVYGHLRPVLLGRFCRRVDLKTQRRFVDALWRTADVALNDGHAVRCQRSGLVRADGRRVAHRLAGVQMPHQVVVRHHFLHHAHVPHTLRPRPHQQQCRSSIRHCRKNRSTCSIRQCCLDCCWYGRGLNCQKLQISETATENAELWQLQTAKRDEPQMHVLCYITYTPYWTASSRTLCALAVSGQSWLWVQFPWPDSTKPVA